MDYKEHMIVEKWKDIPTEEVLKTKKDAKTILYYTNETYMFIRFFLFVMSPTIVCFLTGSYVLANMLLLPSLLIHFVFWFFYLRGVFIDKDLREAASIISDEVDIVLKERENK